MPPPGFGVSATGYRNMDNPQGSRTVETKNGATFTLGARAFIGAEYFILPKMSLGAEYGWGIGLSTTGSGTQTIETTTGVEYRTYDGYWENRTGNNNEFGGPGDLSGTADDVKYAPNSYVTNSEDTPTESNGSFNIGHMSRATIALNLYF